MKARFEIILGVLFILMMNTGPAFAQAYIQSAQTATVDLDFTGTDLLGFSLDVSFDAAVVNYTSVEAGAFLGDNGFVTALNINNTTGSVHIEGAVLKTGGGTASGSGVIATLTFTGVGEGNSTILLSSQDFRDGDNNPLTGYTVVVNRQIIVDDTSPTMETLSESQGVYYNTTPVLSNFGFDDNEELDDVEYKIDSGSWTMIQENISGASYDNEPWSLPVFAGLSDGTHTVYFRVSDDAGNVNDSNSWQFYKDVTAPTMESIAESEGLYLASAPSLSNFGFDDNLELELVEYNMDGGGWSTIQDNISGSTYDNDGWTLPGFAGLSEGTHTINFQVTDQAGNVNTASYSWQFYKDVTAPTMETISEYTGNYYAVAPSFSNFGFDDNLELELVEYNVDGGGWNTIQDNISGSTYDNDGWTLSVFGTLSEGSHSINFQVTDDAGTVNSTAYSWQFYKDTALPGCVENVTAAPGGSIDLSWDPPGGGWDPNFDRIEIYRIPQAAGYPGYSSAESYPDHSVPGNLVHTITSTSTTSWRDPVSGLEPGTRDIYHYQIFVVDAAGNYSEEDAAARARATNYLPGDVASPDGYATTYDNTVDFEDLAVFSAAYGTETGDAFYNAECDFGPTHDNSRLGIPQPWSGTIPYQIQFEDLMIFAMNYHQSLTKGSSGFNPKGTLEDCLALRLQGDFAFGTEKSCIVTVHLSNNGQCVKGGSIKISYKGMVLKQVSSTDLTISKDVFFHWDQGNGFIELSMAFLGQQNVVSCSGDLAVLHFQYINPEDISIDFDTGEIRGLQNQSLDVLLSSEVKPVQTGAPDHFELAQNYPNPFNGYTVITYSLAEKRKVNLEIYNGLGQSICELVNREQDPGTYQVIWDGLDGSGIPVSSGLYFFRIQAGDFHQLRKMIFMK